MKVLWFENTEPSGYNQSSTIVNGWQDALETIVTQCKEIEFYIAFASQKHTKPQKNESVTYIPIYTPYSFLDKIKRSISWDIEAKKIITGAQKIIHDVAPDIIHVFGTEWPFGLISQYTDIPVVIHIQGCYNEIVKYQYPYNYSFTDELYEKRLHPIQFVEKLFHPNLNKSRQIIENKIWQINKFYMGRTEWDNQLSEKLHPGREYYHVDEALRKAFIHTSQHWQFNDNNKTTLFSTGCSSFWKGPNLLLRTAAILKKRNFKFDWLVAGEMPTDLKKIIERKEKKSFEENSIHFLGWQTPNQLCKLLASSSLYIHNSYIENSPNSICEAQYIGIPVISTNVGGIPSLIESKKTGILIPPDAPEQMAQAIIDSAHNKELLSYISNESQKKAEHRHNEKNILNQLLNCYKTILSLPKY